MESRFYSGPALDGLLYERLIALVAEKGVFGEYMHITSLNDGPVTFLLDSTRLF